MAIKLIEYIKNPLNKKALVFGTNLGATIINQPISTIYSEFNAQIDAIIAFHEHFNSDFLITAMDLSVEAECFGSEVKFMDNNAPVIAGRYISNISQIDSMYIPDVGEKRSQLYVDVLKKLISLRFDKPILGGITGPFSLACRLFGVEEMLELSLLDQMNASKLIEKCNQFIIKFAHVIKNVGASGIVLSEPTAGLLSPELLSKFSSKFINRLIEEIQSPYFNVIYHNCAARIPHLKPVFESNASVFHFGEPMDVLTALKSSNSGRIISGNLDPVKVFLFSNSANIIEKTIDLLQKTDNYLNFLIGPGCDLPPGTPLENLLEFFSTIRN